MLDGRFFLTRFENHSIPELINVFVQKSIPETLEKRQNTAFRISIMRAVGQARAYAVPATDVKAAVVATRITIIKAIQQRVRTDALAFKCVVVYPSDMAICSSK